MESDHRLLRDPPCRLKVQNIGVTQLCKNFGLRGLPRRHSLAGGLEAGGVWCRICETAGTPSPDKHALAAELLLQTCKLASEFFYTSFHRFQSLAQPRIGGRLGRRHGCGTRKVAGGFGAEPMSPATLLRAGLPLQRDCQRSVARSHLAQGGLDLGKLGEGVQPAAARSELTRRLRPPQQEQGQERLRRRVQPETATDRLAPALDACTIASPRQDVFA